MFSLDGVLSLTREKIMLENFLFSHETVRAFHGVGSTLADWIGSD